MNAGSKEYIEWVKLQTKNIDPEKETDSIADDLVQNAEDLHTEEKPVLV